MIYKLLGGSSLEKNDFPCPSSQLVINYPLLHFWAWGLITFSSSMLTCKLGLSLCNSCLGHKLLRFQRFIFPVKYRRQHLAANILVPWLLYSFFPHFVSSLWTKSAVDVSGGDLIYLHSSKELLGNFFDNSLEYETQIYHTT